MTVRNGSYIGDLAPLGLWPRSRLGQIILGTQVTPPVLLPVIQNVTPSIAFDIDPATPISFDVISDIGLSSTMLLCLPTMFVDQVTGAPELVHNGTTFMPLYLKHSTRTAISHGFHYVILRDGGWPTPPVLGLYVANNVAGVLVV